MNISHTKLSNDFGRLGMSHKSHLDQIYPFVFHQREKVIQVWNIEVELTMTIFIFGQTINLINEPQQVQMLQIIAINGEFQLSRTKVY